MVHPMSWFLSAVEGRGEEGGICVQSIPKLVARLLDKIYARGRASFAIHPYVDSGVVMKVDKGTISMVWSKVVGSQEIRAQE